MSRKTKLAGTREARSEALVDVGARKVSLKPFDAPKNGDALPDSNFSSRPIVYAARVDSDGSRLAVATSDGFVRILGIQFPDISYKIAELVVDGKDEDVEGCNVWDVAWGDSRNFGSVLAACSEDRKIRVWRERGEEWVKWFEWTCEDKAGNSLRWAPLGSKSDRIMLAVGCSDGSVLVLSHLDKPQDESGWTVQTVPEAHAHGVTVIHWGPVRRLFRPGFEKRPLLITGGGDTHIKMWVPSQNSDGWERDSKLSAHEDWISDVAWAPCVGIRVRHVLASAGRDKKVIVWDQASPTAIWVPKVVTHTHETPWSLSFNPTGHMLSVAEADGRVAIWRENQDKWEEVPFGQKVRDYHEAMSLLRISSQATAYEPESNSASIAPSVNLDSLEKPDANRTYDSDVFKDDYSSGQWPAATYNFPDYQAYQAYYQQVQNRQYPTPQQDYYHDRTPLHDSRSYTRYPYAYGDQGTEHRTSRKPSDQRVQKYDDYDYSQDRSYSSRDKSDRSYRDGRY